MINTLKSLTEKVDNVQEHMCNVSTVMEMLQKNQKEIQEIKKI